jgi:hypothetical protein
MSLSKIIGLLSLACIALLAHTRNATSTDFQWNFDPQSWSESVRISNDDGGEVEVYEKKYRKWRDAGTRIVIDGDCISACTLLLGLIPRDRVCVTERADLGFHSVIVPNEKGRFVHSESDTRELVSTYYSAAVQAWIKRNGGLPNAALTDRLLHLRGSELLTVTGYRRCG